MRFRYDKYECVQCTKQVSFFSFSWKWKLNAKRTLELYQIL